jgi:hypothetical protein
VLTGEAAEPKADELQIDRIHRGLDNLTKRDREIVEQMIDAMKQKNPEGTQ